MRALIVAATLASIMAMTRNLAQPQVSVPLRGEVLDAATGKSICARVYVQAADGNWYFAKSSSPAGSAVIYDKQRGANSVERHATLSAHPFVVDVPPGKYTVTVERGKEYEPEVRTVEVGPSGQPVRVTIRLRRWIDMAARGWYSGDTHVHRALDELSNVMLAEDVNVAFPLSYWVAQAHASPRDSRMSARGLVPSSLVKVDATHVYWPLNTEYEITRVENRTFVLGGFFVLNHKSVFDVGAPPVRPVAEQARREGALIELDKHNWFWAMMLVPVMPADLYELSNNHVWQTKFGFPAFGDTAPEYMKVERDDKGFTERGWIEYGFQNYYALLNCGYRLRPTAGTASGVHPVPLGFGRVYVHQPNGFDYEGWLRGLNEGRSFVTTGPMLFARTNKQDPGHVFRVTKPSQQELRVTGETVSANPLKSIEIIVNGEVVRRVQPQNRRTKTGAFESRIDERVRVDGPSWLIVRCFEGRPDERPRFAHTAPWHVEVLDLPLRPRREEALFLIQRMEEKLARTEGAWPEAVRGEYRQALRAYQKLLETAR